MKKFYIFLLFTSYFMTFTIAQNKDTKKADDLYDDYAFAAAIDAYSSLMKKGKGNNYVYGKLASSYYELGDYKNAEPLYAQATRAKNVSPELIYAYAQTLKANGKASDYEMWMQKFVAVQPADSRAQAFKRNPSYLTKLLATEPAFSVTNAGSLNSTYADYGSHIQGNTMFFASARNTSRKSHDLNNEPFLDLYTATIDGSKMGEATLLAGDVNTKYHEGIVTISKDGTRMFFDRNGYLDKDLNKDVNGLNQINIYIAQKVGGVWGNIQSVPFNSDNFSTGHPALSADGKTLYFSSDRPGGKGGSDLYKVAVSEEGTFGEIQPLGNTINTEGTEAFPYLAGDGTLYFSSDGHLGLGGLDVFYSEDGNGTPKNVGPGVNSNADDFAMYLNNDGLSGYISSNRSGGKGSDDIYILSQLPPCDVDVALIAKDQEGNGIPNAHLIVENLKEETSESDTATTTGKYLFQSKCNRTYTITVRAEGFNDATKTLTVGKKDVNSTISLVPTVVAARVTDMEVLLNPIFFDFDKASIRPSAAAELDGLVSIMNTYPKMQIIAESHTDNRGPASYNQQLSERRAKAMVDYVIRQGIAANRIRSIGKGETDLAVDCGTTCSEAQHQENRRSVFKIVKQ